MVDVLFGDSHVRPLVFFQSQSFRVYPISGATMSGIVNPNSKTNAEKIIRESLEEDVYDNIFLSLGEVDAGFLSLVNSQSIEEAKEKIDRAVARYSKFVNQMVEKNPGSNIYILNVVPPIIKDKHLKKCKIKMRRDIAFDIEDRDTVVRYCNERIDSAFDDVIDVYSEFKKRMEECRYWHVNRKDHHFSSNFYYSVMAGLLSRYNVALSSRAGGGLYLYLNDVKSFFK